MGGKRKIVCVDVKSNGLSSWPAVIGGPRDGFGSAARRVGGVISVEGNCGQKFDLELGRQNLAGSSSIGDDRMIKTE